MPGVGLGCLHLPETVPGGNMSDRRHALIFNAITRGLADADRFVALSEREAIARRIGEALDADPADLDDDEAAELGADAYDLDIAAAALRQFADLIDRGPAAPSTPLPPSVYSQLARENADAAAAKAERLRARIPAPDEGRCEVIDVDGQPVRVQAAPDMPTEVRDALEDVIRTVQRNYGADQS